MRKIGNSLLFILLGLVIITYLAFRQIPVAVIYGLLLLSIGLTIWILWTVVLGAGFQPTSKMVVRKMLDMAEIGPQDVLYDLGSGDGRIITAAVKSYGARAVGIEADPIRVLWSRMLLFLNKIQGKSNIKWGNFFNADLSEATAVTVFLGDKANQKLKVKLLKELKPGTPVVSYVWTFDDWKPIKVDQRDRIYLYRTFE
jgi:ribosomal protein L11 methylase PrmA